jgi:hypothetical protein
VKSAFPQSSPGPERGYTLPLALFAILALATSARLISRYAAEGFLTLREIRRGEQNHEELKQAITHTTIGSGECSPHAVFQDGKMTKVIACRDRPLPFTTQPLIALPNGTIDYEAIFDNASVCQTSSVNSTTGPPAIPHASRDCRVSGTHTQDIVLLENIEASELSIRPKSSSRPPVLASPGSIRITKALLIDTDLTIVAGGDIDIEKIAHPGTDEIRVAIFSSLGNIHIQSVEPGVSLLLGGRSSLQAPTTAPSPYYPIPAFRAFSLRGFMKR